MNRKQIHREDAKDVETARSVLHAVRASAVPFLKSAVSPIFTFHFSIFSLSILLACLAGPSLGSVLYWDTNGTTPGWGTTAGIWGTDSFWSTDPTGTFSDTPGTSSTSGSDDANFGYPSATLGYSHNQYSVTINTTVSASSITFNGRGFGNLSIGGNGTVNLGAGGLLNNAVTGGGNSAVGFSPNIALSAGSGVSTVIANNDICSYQGGLTVSGSVTGNSDLSFTTRNINGGNSLGTVNMAGTLTGKGYGLATATIALIGSNVTSLTQSNYFPDQQLLVTSFSSGFTGTLASASGVLVLKDKSYYGGATDFTHWTGSNITVATGATLAFQSTFSGTPGGDIDTLLNSGHLGGAEGGFSAGSFIGFNAAYTYSGNGIPDTNGGTNSIGLKKLGAGTILTLGGNNTYTGPTFVETGILLLNSTGALAGGGNITFGPVVFDYTGYYPRDPFPTGATTINAGTLQFSSNSATSFFNNVVNSSRPMQFDSNGQNINFFGLIDTSNTGLNGTVAPLIKLGLGTLALCGTNTYTGMTTISAGTLQLGNNTSTGSINPNSPIVNNATLAFGRNDTAAQGVDFNIVISGSGGVAQLGSGTTHLDGTNTYTGGTAIKAGTLAMTTINDISVAGSLGNSTNPVTMGNTNGLRSTLRVKGTNAAYACNRKFVMTTGGSGAFQIDNAGTTQTLSGVISGEGGLVKTGPGNLIISATNTFAGNLTIEEGTLGGFYGSSAGALTNKSTATLSPGMDSYATFTNTGKVMLESGSTLRINLGGVSNDILVAGGEVTLSGTLSLLARSPYLAASYVIVSSTGGVSGTFAATNGLPPGFSVVYETARVLISLPLRPIINVLGTNNSLIEIGNSLPDQTSGTDFGCVPPGTSVTNTFVVTNAGTAPLTFTGAPAVTISGHTNDFIISSQPSSMTIAPNGTGAFSVVFVTPPLNISRTGLVSIVTDDSANNPYTFAIRGGPRNGIWTNDTSGYWRGVFNWLDGSVAQGPTFTAAFVADITAGRTVTNDMSSLSIGHLFFADLVTNNNWTLTGNQLNFANAGSGSTIFVSNQNATISCVLAGAETLTKSGPGMLTLTVGNSYTGRTVIAGGTLNITANTAIGPNPASLVADSLTVDGGTFIVNTGGNFNWLTRGLVIGPNGGTFSGENWGGPISGSGNVYVAGTWTENYVGGGGTPGPYPNSYTGDTIILAGGSLTVGRFDSLQYSTLDLSYQANGFTRGIVENYLILGGLKGTQNWALNATQSGGIHIGNNNKDTSYSGVLSGAGVPIIKTGTGTLTLSGNNTYTAGTTVNGGTLVLPGINASAGTTMINTGRLV
ncbi:MAG: autotransporter-associated beta strand repeat-containing protein, partial [bacterium]